MSPWRYARGSNESIPEPKGTRIADAFLGFVLSAVLVPLLGAVDAAALNAKLSNGVTLQTVHPAGATDVAIRVLVPVGSRNDPRGREVSRITSSTSWPPTPVHSRRGPPMARCGFRLTDMQMLLPGRPPPCM
jgi:hypothetical protein